MRDYLKGFFLACSTRGRRCAPAGNFRFSADEVFTLSRRYAKTFHCASGKIKAARRTPGGRKTISAFQSGISLCGGFYKCSPSHKKNAAAQWLKGSKALFKFRFALSKLNSAARMKRSRRLCKKRHAENKAQENAAQKKRGRENPSRDCRVFLIRKCANARESARIPTLLRAALPSRAPSRVSPLRANRGRNIF